MLSKDITKLMNYIEKFSTKYNLHTGSVMLHGMKEEDLAKEGYDIEDNINYKVVHIRTATCDYYFFPAKSNRDEHEQERTNKRLNSDSAGF